MFDSETEFAYVSRRARQEEIAAINATGSAAALAHRHLSRLYAARALVALISPDRLDPVADIDPRYMPRREPSASLEPALC